MPPPTTMKSACNSTGCYPTIDLRRHPAHQPRTGHRVDRTRIDVRTDFGRLSHRRSNRGCSASLRQLLAEEHFAGPRRSSSAAPRCGACTARRSRARCRGVECILIPDGERAKTLQTASRVYDALVTAQADRGAGIVAIGGGVIGDTAGFAAATYLRGISVAHVPTTLLAQVDSAVGGKVGVNHALGKNLIGAFHQPQLVAIDPLVLTTLPRREFRAGLYEVVKYGMAFDAALFEQVRSEHAGDLRPQPRGAVAHHRHQLPHQGRGRAGGRARTRPAAPAELRTHRRPRARGRSRSTGASATARPSRSG